MLSRMRAELPNARIVREQRAATVFSFQKATNNFWRKLPAAQLPHQTGTATLSEASEL